MDKDSEKVVLTEKKKVVLTEKKIDQILSQVNDKEQVQELIDRAVEKALDKKEREKEKKRPANLPRNPITLPNGNDESKDYQAIVKQLQVKKLSITEKVGDPPICIEITSSEKPCIYGTLGNISMVLGQAKSRKTFVVSAIVAAAIKNQECLKFKGSLPKEKRQVVLFDTEQGRYHARNVLERIHSLTATEKTKDIDKFDYFPLRGSNPQEIIEFVEAYIYETPGLGLVVIDGIKDLVKDINDQIDCNKLVTSLLKWTAEKDIHIVVVLHENKGDKNARGHLGAELTNKCESVITVEKTGEISTVKAKHLRSQEFPSFSFAVDIDSNPVNYTAEKPPEEGTKPEAYTREQHVKILKAIFSDKKGLAYNVLWPKIKEEFSKRNINMGDNKAKSFLTYYEQNELIVNSSKSKKSAYDLNV